MPACLFWVSLCPNSAKEVLWDKSVEFLAQVNLYEWARVQAEILLSHKSAFLKSTLMTTAPGYCNFKIYERLNFTLFWNKLNFLSPVQILCLICNINLKKKELTFGAKQFLEFYTAELTASNYLHLIKTYCINYN